MSSPLHNICFSFGLSLETKYNVAIVNALDKIGTVIQDDNITFDKLIEGITNSQKIATDNYSAVADNLSSNCAAWVNGNYIVGTGGDNNTFYAKGFADGYAEGSVSSTNPEYEVVYEYHEHNGVACDNASTCTVHTYCQMQPQYHAHTGQTGSCYKPKICGTKVGAPNDDGYGVCDNAHWHKGGSDNIKWCDKVVGYTMVCNKANDELEGYICSLPEGTVISAKVNFY